MTVSRRKLPARWYEESTVSAEASSAQGRWLTSSSAPRKRNLPGPTGGSGAAVTTTTSTSENGDSSASSGRPTVEPLK